MLKLEAHRLMFGIYQMLNKALLNKWILNAKEFFIQNKNSLGEAVLSGPFLCLGVISGTAAAILLLV